MALAKDRLTARALAIHHPDPVLREALTRLRPELPTDPKSGLAGVVFEAGQAVLAPVVTAEEVMSEPYLSLARVTPVHSWLGVPLRAGRACVGALVLFRSSPERPYSAQDLAFIEEIAARASLSLANAELYEQAQAASRAKDDFLATVSHELRTPLTAILGWAQLAQVQPSSAGSGGRALATIERNARALGHLVDDLLDVTRVIAGKLFLDIRPVEVAPVLRAAVEVLAPISAAKRVAVTCALDPQAHFVRGDAQRLQQVVWNLLANAIKFTPEGGDVTVRLDTADDRVLITVADSGEGIEASFLPHVFDRFRQADSTSTRKHGGLGLGLAIVRQLVELHKGTVRADSAGPGRGATFTVELPLAPAPRPRRRNTAERAALTLAGLRVMVVDDDREALQVVTEMLRRQEADVCACSSGARALEALQAWRPDALVCDIAMPRMDGYEFLRAARSVCAPIPALALSAGARAEDRQAALVAGFQLHLAKPVEPAELAVAVLTLAGRAGNRIR